MCHTALDPVSLLGRALVLPRVPRLRTSRLQLILVARVGGARLHELHRWTTLLRSYCSPLHPLLLRLPSCSWYWSASPAAPHPLLLLCLCILCFAVSTVNKGTGIVAAATATDGQIKV
jgi:hypothetical protein